MTESTHNNTQCLPLEEITFMIRGYGSFRKDGIAYNKFCDLSEELEWPIDKSDTDIYDINTNTGESHRRQFHKFYRRKQTIEVAIITIEKLGWRKATCTESSRELIYYRWFIGDESEDKSLSRY